MGWLNNTDADVKAWRAKENKLQDEVERLDDRYGQDDPRTRKAYKALEAHCQDKPLRLWGRR